MSDLGAIGVVYDQRYRRAQFVFGRTAAADISGSGATPGAVVVAYLRGREVGATFARANGTWTLPGLNDGTYWASEIGTPRGWSIEVAGATVTVTLEEGSGGGGTVVAGYAYAWGG